MPFDPTYPPQDAEIESAPLRAQLNGLKDLIDALPSITAAQVDGVNTVAPGDPADVSLTVNGQTLHFTFHIPQGVEGAQGPAGQDGMSGADGQNGADGAQGEPGLPGEVSLQQLTDAINTSSGNSNAVDVLSLSVSDPPTQGEVQTLVNKIDELIQALRR